MTKKELNDLIITKELSEVKLEDLIKKYPDIINWELISKFQTLSEKFIEKHQDKVVWLCIYKHQTLSKKFIEKYKDKTYWNLISRYQKLSPEFILKNIDRITKDIFKNMYYKDLPENIKLLLRLKIR